MFRPLLPTMYPVDPLDWGSLLLLVNMKTMKEVRGTLLGLEKRFEPNSSCLLPSPSCLLGTKQTVVLVSNYHLSMRATGIRRRRSALKRTVDGRLVALSSSPIYFPVSR